MSKKKLSEDKLQGEIFLGYIGSLFADSWIAMMALGGLAHHLHKPNLAIGYTTAMLITIVLWAWTDSGISTAIRLDYIARMMLRGGRP